MLAVMKSHGKCYPTDLVERFFQTQRMPRWMICGQPSTSKLTLKSRLKTKILHDFVFEKCRRRCVREKKVRTVKYGSNEHAFNENSSEKK